MATSGRILMRLWRRYAVTVMDNWTPMQMFWTLQGAKRFMDAYPESSHLFFWNGGWQRIGGTSKELV